MKRQKITLDCDEATPSNKKRKCTTDWSTAANISVPIDSIHSPIQPAFETASGLRLVKPYYFIYESWCKKRWIARKLIDVMHEEFHSRSPTYFERSIKLGRLRVNGQDILSTYVLNAHDLIEHLVHRHESPVLDQSIEIVEETDDLLVINKPCSLPVHPCGRYRHNSVVHLLKWQFGYNNLKVLHRLDKTTSGLLLIGKTIKKTQQIEKQMQNRAVYKTYLARVVGQFPDCETICDQPLGPICKKMGVHGVLAESKGGKHAQTRFKRLSFNGESSIVECHPETGRTHQIRIHLQFLGFPIINDSLYNSECFGINKGKHAEYGKSRNQLIEDLWKEHSRQINYLSDESLADRTPFEIDASDSPIVAKEDADHLEAGEKDGMLVLEPHFDSHCYDCQTQPELPAPVQLSMHLHCWKYEGPGWAFESPMPDWARENL